jgi:hypothetical protein
MSPLLTNIFSLSSCIAGIIALIRFSRIDRIYRLFLYVVWLSCINDIAFSLITSYGKGWILYSINMIGNIYSLLSVFLIVILLKKFNAFKKIESIYPIILVVIFGLWILGIFTSDKTWGRYVYFQIGSSLIIVLFAINSINGLIFTTRRTIIINPVFIFCIAFIIFYTYNIIVEIFWLYGLNASLSFLKSVVSIIIYIQVITNLLNAVAILLMPKKEPYTALVL